MAGRWETVWDPIHTAAMKFLQWQTQERGGNSNNNDGNNSNEHNSQDSTITHPLPKLPAIRPQAFVDLEVEEDEDDSEEFDDIAAEVFDAGDTED